MKIYLDIDPPRTTAQQKGERVTRSGHIFHYIKPKVQEATDILTWELSQYAPDAPIDGPVSLHTVWVFSRACKPKGGWKTTRPDTDNLQKLLKDVMTKCGYWIDDSFVVKDTCEKRWEGTEGEYARRGIYIELRELSD